MTVGVLHVSTSRPDADALGGVAVHVAALSSLSPPDIAVHTAHVAPGELRVERWGPRALSSVLPLDPGDPGGLEASLTAAIVGTGARVLHVHSPMLGARALSSAIRKSGVRAVVSLHDGALACENHELLEKGAHFCGVPTEPSRCDACLQKTHGRPPGSIVSWRRDMAELVRATDAFVNPSASALTNAARVHPEVVERARRIPWGVPVPATRSTRSAAEPGPLRIAVVGLWTPVKGRDRLPAMLFASRKLDVEWHLFGATEGASLAEIRASAPRVVPHGAYRRAALAQRLVQSGCHIGLLASVAAESFSLTLSEVAAAGLPVVASDLGALGERTRAEELGWTFDPRNPKGFATLLERLVGNRAAVDAAAARVRARTLRTEEDMVREHAVLWRELAGRPPNREVDPVVLERARADHAAGARRAAAARPSLLREVVDRIRKTDTYRDLKLRRVLSEETRTRVERALERLTSPTRRS